SPIFSQLTQTRLVRLNHATADQARRLVSEYYANYVRFDPETNTALITAPPDLLERIEADLAQVDQPLPQVAIEAIVPEVSEEGRKELGLDWQLKNEPGGCGMARPWPWAVWSRRARNR
ncbi:secretin N-terminal domain-containing protein, partial [Limnochorda pilosa]|uniref:secretin N-terminal domain-containing protein n=1 Tax=Limnochorda pilosa TaxID=1555112 RepID=UPI0026EA1B52